MRKVIIHHLDGSIETGFVAGDGLRNTGLHFCKTEALEYNKYSVLIHPSQVKRIEYIEIPEQSVKNGAM